MDLTARFQDNSSPEPSNGMNASCFKTPDINTFSSFGSMLSQSSNLYPTPPSDSESYASLPGANNYMATPKFAQYYMASSPESAYTSSPDFAKNPYQSAEQVYSSPESASSENGLSAIVSKKHGDVSAGQTGSRFKRRSRTTFSKSQVTYRKSQKADICTWYLPGT